MHQLPTRILSVLTAALVLLSVSGVAETPGGVHIYTQDNYGGGEWILPGNSSRTLETSGCMLFSYAHMIQYLTRTSRGDDLIRELLTVCSDPNGYEGHPECTHGSLTDMTGLAYRSHAESRYGIKSETAKKTEAFLEHYLTTGGVVMLSGLSTSGGKHRTAAVGFKRDENGSAYLQLIDSHPDSYHTSELYVTYYDDSLSPWSTYPSEGAAYWIKYRQIQYSSGFLFPTAHRIALTGLSVSPAGAVLCLPGDTITLSAAVTPSLAFQGVDWSSSDESVATVDASGLVTPIAPGACTITAVSQAEADLSAVCTVIVTDAPLEICITQGPAYAQVGDTAAYTAQVLPEALSALPLVWQSSDPAVAAIDAASGTVTCLCAGETCITAAPYPGCDVQASLTLHVLPRLADYDALLPQGTTEIPAEAFAGTAIEHFRCPEGLTSIGARAFAGSALVSVYLPDSVTDIADDAFDGCGAVILRSGSDYAAAYALSVGLPLADLDD